MNTNPMVKAGRVRAAAATLCTALLLGSASLVAPAMAQSTMAPSAMSQSAAPKPGEDAGGRIQRLHDQLQITPGQEALWKTVAAVMQNNAQVIATTMQARQDKAERMNAVDDIVSYGTIAEAHADGLKKLAAAFAPLYAAMPPAQQRNADMVFGHAGRPAQ
jgi:hypothetical protein